MPKTYLVSIKEKDGKLVGLFLNPSNFQQPITIYEDIWVTYNHQQVPAYNYVVRYGYDKSKNLVKEFPLKIGKKNDGDYFIIEPDDEEQRRALTNLPHDSVHRTDFV